MTLSTIVLKSKRKSLTISLFDPQEHHHGADEKHSSYNACSYHVHLLLQREKNKHVAYINPSLLPQPAQSSLFWACPQSLIYNVLKRLKDLSASFHHAICPFWKQIITLGVSFLKENLCVYIYFILFSFSHYNSSCMIHCPWLSVLFSTRVLNCKLHHAHYVVQTQA